MKELGNTLRYKHMPDGLGAKLAGRVILFRNNGNICFGKIQDAFGRIQFVLKKDANEDLFKAWRKNVKIGDIIRIRGQVWTSSTGERSILVDSDLELLRRSIHPFPDKWKGVADAETRIKKRYLDILLDPEYAEVFRRRAELIRNLRGVLEYHFFMEVETPTLAPQASGAQARPFKTHHNALDADLYLRIAPETYLKRAVGAGFDRVFEIGKNFRNEGMDPSHLQEFTSIEWYAAYWDYMDNLEFFRDEMLPSIFVPDWNEIDRGFVIQYQDAFLDFSDIPVVEFAKLFRDNVGRDWQDCGLYETDELFKKHVRPKLIQPVFVIDYPAHMCPLAQRKESNPQYAEQWQLIANSWELVKCYTELTDPVEQRRLLEMQKRLRDAGDEEAVSLEEDFLLAMEYGMPPMSGLGMGIDRMVALLTNQKTLRDVVMFPLHL